MEIKGQDGCYLYMRPQEEEKSIEEYGSCLKMLKENAANREEQILSIANDMKVLIIEDNIACQKLITAYLKTLGIKSISMRSGEEAIEYMRSGVCDLVLVDQILPDMEGVEIAKTIRKQRNLDEQFPPIVMMVSYEAPDMEKILEESGILDYMIKPIDIKQLKRIILAYQREGKA
ncbi:MAG: response regulator [Lachnospiraceae bacterium]|nr:response regulator [Lachnospiraceae bacterium]